MELDNILGAALMAAAIAALPAMAADSNVAPAEGTQGNVSFVSGGVGEDEAAAMKSAAAGYSLELQFVQKATPRDEFLADVKVRITDRAKNVVLDTVTTGPYLLAKLPSGTYQVEADHRGMTKRQTVDIRSGRHQRSVFVWTPSADDIRQSMLEQPDRETALR